MVPETHEGIQIIRRFVKHHEGHDLRTLRYLVGYNILHAWAAVLIGVKPGEEAPQPYNRLFFEGIQALKPEFAASFDVVPFRFFPEKDWFVNKNLILNVVNDNSDLFSNGKSVEDYEAAKNSLAAPLSDPNTRDITTGLLYGYPRKDCEAWYQCRAISQHLGGHRIGHLMELGLSKVESYFIDIFASDPTPALLRRWAIGMLSRHVDIDNELRELWIERMWRRDKYNTTAWTGLKRNSAEATARLTMINQRFRETGMDRIIASVQKYKRRN